ncbi:hypothetical protein SH501x_001455 [Pirellulaceae bacterium SH501]
MIDPLRLQSLVDGECSVSQRRELLESCDSNPSQWKEVALALLEEQQFSKHIRAVTPPSRAIAPDGTRAGSRSNAGSQSSTEETAPLSLVSLPATTDTPSRPAHPSSQSSSWWPMLAAGFIGLAAFFGGRMLPFSDQSDVIGPDVRATTFKPAIEPGSVAANQLVSTQNNPYEGLPETDLRVQIGNEDIPIFDPEELDPQLVMALQAYEVQKANQRLRQQGFEIDLRPEYMTGQLNDGRQVVVPIHQVGLRAYGQ